MRLSLGVFPGWFQRLTFLLSLTRSLTLTRTDVRLSRGVFPGWFQRLVDRRLLGNSGDEASIGA